MNKWECIFLSILMLGMSTCSTTCVYYDGKARMERAKNKR